jgi:site-specific recombinase XerD
LTGHHGVGFLREKPLVLGMDLVELMKKELVRRHYSPRTVESYVFCVEKFLLWCGDKEPRRITKHDIKDYLSWLCERKLASSTLNLHQQALKFALENVLNKRFFIDLPFSKVPSRLPEVLTQEEVIRLFDAIDNSKHSLMVRLMYSSGLRVSELVNLRVRDFEFDKGYGWVRRGKGCKDRLFVLASGIRQELSDFIALNGLRYESWIFIGNKYGHLTSRTVYAIVKQASVKAGLGKRVHPHTLRHSFATHLIENGYDVVRVQALLGHNSTDTTMVYVHMASPDLLNVKSPYDDLMH